MTTLAQLIQQALEFQDEDQHQRAAQLLDQHIKTNDDLNAWQIHQALTIKATILESSTDKTHHLDAVMELAQFVESTRKYWHRAEANANALASLALLDHGELEQAKDIGERALELAQDLSEVTPDLDNLRRRLQALSS